MCNVHNGIAGVQDPVVINSEVTSAYVFQLWNLGQII